MYILPWVTLSLRKYPLHYLTGHPCRKSCIGSYTGWMWWTGWTTRSASSSTNASMVLLPAIYLISAFRLQLSPVATTCVHPRGWTDNCTSHEPKPRHWAHEGFITPRLPCGTRSRWTCVIPDSRSTPLEQNWNLTFSQLIDFFLLSIHVLYFVAYSPCAPAWCLLAGAYKCLNWIELNWHPRM